jgi:MFS family permease
VILALWNSPLALGVVSVANAVPTLLIMLFGGVVADRGDKRRILLITQVAMCATAAAIGVFVATDTVQIWMIIVASAAIGIAFGYDMPAYSALMPELVPPEKISQVVALNSSTFHGTRMVGPAMAGGVIAATGVAAAYFLNALSFVAVIFSLLIIRYRPRPRADVERRSAIADLRAGLAHARQRPYLLVMLLMTAINVTFMFPTMAILSPDYVKNTLDRGPGVLGAFWAMSGVGSLAGALVLVWWPTQFRAARIWLAALAGPAALTVMALTRDPVVAITCAAVTSLAFSTQLSLFQTMIQESTPNDFRGRVMSLHGLAFNGTMPFAVFSSAALGAVIGLPAVMIISSVAFTVLAVVVLRVGAGGIGRVVRSAEREYQVVSAAAG